ncbi:hypothetical protein [Cellulophaga omnivescoria]|uniref:hypothetical protein n=1 Tax=Cellulophaga omnivescoria TaxID=1888890 RepID=UPI000986D793|nr:hypothetical protein [Cellulophaga omnivescoria]WBU89173.1 hypothetical protein PBN93_15025 [Cellulophaga omnivescoria]
MKKHIITSVLCAAFAAISCQTEAIDTTEDVVATPSNTGINYVDESAFINSLSTETFLNPTDISLNRNATTAGYNQVYGFNIPEDNQVLGFKWNTGDQNTTDWRPQGITGFTWNQKRFLLATWYGIGPSNINGVENQHKGVRISLVDITNPNNITYRHILLVQDKNNISNPKLFKATNSYDQLNLFAPVTVHAGGVAYANQKIYVASTSLGLRVFDLNNIIAVSSDNTKNKIGQDANGDLKAFNYGYILPQSGYYDILDGDPFSCVSLGENTTGNNMLYTSQYKTSSSSIIPSVYGFNLSSNGDIDTYITAEISVPKDNASGNNGPLYNIQGVYRKDSTSVFAVTGKSSYKGSTARLVRYTDGEASGTRYRWPHGAEDFYLEKSTGLLWNLTEYETSKYGEENRTVFAVRYADYN